MTQYDLLAILAICAPINLAIAVFNTIRSLRRGRG